jgi:hypothetical protein
VWQADRVEIVVDQVQQCLAVGLVLNGAQFSAVSARLTSIWKRSLAPLPPSPKFVHICAGLGAWVRVNDV